MSVFEHTDAFIRQYQEFLKTEPSRPAQYRQYLKQARELLNQQFHAGLDIRTLLHAHTHVIDNLLKGLWEQILPEEADLNATLIAVGGYGRKELHPQSDIDLLILLKATPNEHCSERLSQFITMLWDIGLEVGHSVRTLDECDMVARQDLTIITNLIESRYVTGSHDLFESLNRTIAPHKMWSSADFFRAKLEEQKQRHINFGDTSYRVEPNLKEGRGGLRDIQMITWIIKREYGQLSLQELHEHQLLEPGEYSTLQRGRAFLWRIRFLLHQMTGRKEDRLLFDYQYTLAQAFGYNDPNRNIAVEAFMHQYYRTITELERLTDVLIGVLRDKVLMPRYPAPVMVGERYQRYGSYLAVNSPDTFVLYPTALLEIFLVMQITPGITGLTPDTIRLIRRNVHRIDNSFRQQARHRQIFRQILQQKAGITFVMRLMNRFGILAAYIPAFASIVGRMQYDLFHVYTVDEHTLWVLRNLRRYSTAAGEQEMPFCSQVFRNLQKPELLYLAGIFHDIAKGRQGDHSELGAKDAYEFCREHNLDLHDSGIVSWLVRNHLIMSVTAQRKDISDPDVIAEFADQIVEQSRLDYLFLLTIADIKGTNPKLWNGWKESLIHELYHATRRCLQSRIPHSRQSDSLVTEKKRAALEELVKEGFTVDECESLWDRLGEEYLLQHSVESISWHAECLLTASEHALPVVQIRETASGNINLVFIYGHDNGDLFFRVAATMEQLNLNIVQARLVSIDDHDLYTLHVLGPNNQVIRSKGDEEHVVQTLKNNLTIPEVLPRKHHQPRILRNFDIPTRITFRQNIERNLTEMELRTGDMPGLLSRLGAVFYELDLTVRNALITTLGEQAEDVFYITWRDGSMILDTYDQEYIRLRITEALKI